MTTTTTETSENEEKKENDNASTMLAAVLQSDPAQKEQRACFELRRRTKPVLTEKHPPGTMIVQTIVASICGLDFAGQGPVGSERDESNNNNNHGGCHCWRRPLEYLKRIQDSDDCPCFGGTGHELLGKVVDVVEPCKYQVGDRLLVMSPLYMKWVIPHVVKKHSGLVDLECFNHQGGFAEFVMSHDSVCLSVPSAFDRFDPSWFVLAQPIGTILNASHRLLEHTNIMGKTVAIVGQGQNGLLMTQLLAGYKPRRLIVLDRLRERLQVAMDRYGITNAIQVEGGGKEEKEKCNMISHVTSQVSDITHGSMCDVVIDMVGHQHKTLDLCVQLAKPGGTFMIFGLPPAPEEDQFVLRGPAFSKSLSYIPVGPPDLDHFQFAIELLEEGRFDPTGIFTHTVPFEKFPQAYNMAQNYRNGVIKVLLTFANCTTSNLEEAWPDAFP